MILKFLIDRRITGVRRGRKRVPICKGGVEVEGVDVAILLTKRNTVFSLRFRKNFERGADRVWSYCVMPDKYHKMLDSTLLYNPTALLVAIYSAHKSQQTAFATKGVSKTTYITAGVPNYF